MPMSCASLRRLAAGGPILVLLLSAVPAPSFAKKGSDTSFSELSAKEKKKRRKKAKRYEKKGKKAYRKGDYDDAIVAFELAYKQAPDPRFLFNIGRCHDKTGDLFNAMEFTQRYAAEAQEGEEKEDAEELVEMLRAKLAKTSGEVYIKTVPEGATVSLEGKGQSLAGNAPWRRWLIAGPWKAEVSHPGHLPVTKEFSVGLGKSSELSITLVSEAEIAAKEAAAKAKKEAAAEKVAAAKAAAAEAAPEEDTAAAAVEPGPDFRARTGDDGQPPPPSAGVPLIAWIAAGVAVAALGTGFVLSGSVSDKLQERDDLLAARAAGGRQKAGTLEDEAESTALLGNVAFATGGVALVAAGVTWWLGR